MLENTWCRSLCCDSTNPYEMYYLHDSSDLLALLDSKVKTSITFQHLHYFHKGGRKTAKGKGEREKVKGGRRRRQASKETGSMKGQGDGRGYEGKRERRRSRQI